MSIPSFTQYLPSGTVNCIKENAYSGIYSIIQDPNDPNNKKILHVVDHSTPEGKRLEESLRFTKNIQSSYLQSSIVYETNNTNVSIFESPYANHGDLYMEMKFFMDTNRVMDIKLVNQIMFDITVGLSDLFDNDFVHGNIRPENIFLNESADGINAVIGGFSRLSNKIIQVSSIPNFIKDDIFVAPEVKTSGQITRESDVYSAGVIFVMLLNAAHVFSPMSVNKFSDQTTCAELKQMLSGMLQENPQHRLKIKDCMISPYFNEIRKTMKKPLMITECVKYVHTISDALNLTEPYY